MSTHDRAIEWHLERTFVIFVFMQFSDAVSAVLTAVDGLGSADLDDIASSDRKPLLVGAAGDERVDSELLAEVADVSLNQVKPAVEAWRARNHPDRDADIAQVQRGRRYLRLTGQADGMTRVDGLLDPLSASKIRTTLDGFMNQSAFDNTGRTCDQRCADAFTQVCDAASKGELTGGRSNTKLRATVAFDTITERASERGRTHVGATLVATAIRQLACDAGIHRVVTGPASSILDFGHETRLVSDNLFNALVVRDQHCRWPGCTIRATWCRVGQSRIDGPGQLRPALPPTPPAQPPTRVDHHRHRHGARSAPPGRVGQGQQTARRTSAPSRHDRPRARTRRRPGRVIGSPRPAPTRLTVSPVGTRCRARW